MKQNAKMQAPFPFEIIISLYTPILIAIYSNKAPQKFLQPACFYLKQSVLSYRKMSDKEGSMNPFHFTSLYLERCCPPAHKTFRSCRDIGYTEPEPKLN